MFDIMNIGKYTKLERNHYTGEQNRQWIRYADDTFEPVRREGDTRDKYHAEDSLRGLDGGPPPRDWNPAEHGHDVALNHDFYRKGDKPHPLPSRSGLWAKPPANRRGKPWRCARNIGQGKGKSRNASPLPAPPWPKARQQGRRH